MNQRNCQDLYRRYQEKAEETVKRLADKEPFYKIAGSYGFSKDSFRDWLARNGYYQKKPRKLAFSEKVIEEAYRMVLKGASIAEAARKLDVNDETLAKDLKQLFQYTPLPDGKKRVRDDYFENVDTEEKAYWLGFFIADGYNSGNGAIEFLQCDARKDAVEKFKKVINSQHKIGEKIVNGHLAWRLNIKSKKMSADLLNLGITPDKSYSCSLPNVEPQLYPALLRGYFDGDGSLYINKKTKLPTVSFTSAAHSLLQDVQEWLTNNSIISHIYDTNVGRTPNPNWLLCFSGQHAAKFLDIVYMTSTPETRVDSKYQKYKFVLNCRPDLKTV